MQRLPEPELMVDAAQCQAYASANFAASNQMFVEMVCGLIPATAVTVLDVGCGPGDVMIRLAGQCSSLKITAVDGSLEMIQLATKAVENCGLSNTIRTLQGGDRTLFENRVCVNTRPLRIFLCTFSFFFCRQSYSLN